MYIACSDAERLTVHPSQVLTFQPFPVSACLWRVSTVYVIGGHLHPVQPRQTVTQMVSLHHILNSYIPTDNKLRNHHPLDHHFPAKIIVRRFRRSCRARKIEAAKVTILKNISSRVNLQKCLQSLDIHTNLTSFCQFRLQIAFLLRCFVV